MITRAGTLDLLAGTTDTAAKSVRKRPSTGNLRFHLAATNGQVIAASFATVMQAAAASRQVV
jgi:hypothetical protein